MKQIAIGSAILALIANVVHFRTNAPLAFAAEVIFILVTIVIIVTSWPTPCSCPTTASSGSALAANTTTYSNTAYVAPNGVSQTPTRDLNIRALAPMS